MFRLLPTLFLAGGLTAGATLAPLQDKPMERTPQTPATSAQASDADKVLATWLLTGAKLEIEIGQIAAQQAQNPDVKRFAQRMTDDHRQIAQKLQRFAAPASITGGIGATGGAAGGEGNDPTRPREAGASRSPAGGFDHTALIEELGEQHLQTARTFLSEKQDEEFDRCFVGMAIAGHMQSDDMLTVFERHASGELKSTIQEARRTVKQHLQAAKDLAVQIEGPATLRKER